MKQILFILLLLSNININAQFVLTPKDGLKAENNAYTIKRQGSEFENYQAAMRAIRAVIPDGYIDDIEFEKVFTVIAEVTIRMKLKMAIMGFDAISYYTLKVESEDNMILLSFDELEEFKGVLSKGRLAPVVYPWSGENRFFRSIADGVYMFNSSGDSVEPKAKKAIETWANGLIHQIEETLKQQ